MGAVWRGSLQSFQNRGARIIFLIVSNAAAAVGLGDPTLRTVVLDTQMRVYDDSSPTPPCSLDKSVFGNSAFST